MKRQQATQDQLAASPDEEAQRSALSRRGKNVTGVKRKQDLSIYP